MTVPYLTKSSESDFKNELPLIIFVVAITNSVFTAIKRPTLFSRKRISKSTKFFINLQSSCCDKNRSAEISAYVHPPRKNTSTIFAESDCELTLFPSKHTKFQYNLLLRAYQKGFRVFLTSLFAVSRLRLIQRLVEQRSR